MKYIITTLLTISSLLIGNIASAQDGYLIKGRIKGWKDTVCYLGNHYGDKQYVKDTTRIGKNGDFIFKGKKKLPGGIYLIVLPNHKYVEVLIDKEQNFSLETDTTKLVEDMKFKGSADNTAFYKYLNYIIEKQIEITPLRKHLAKLKEDTLAARTTKKDSIKILQDKVLSIDKSVGTFKDDFIKEHPGSFLTTIFRAQKEVSTPETPTLPSGKKDSLFPYRYFKNHFWDNIDLSDDRILRTPIFHMKLKYFFDNVVVQVPDSIIKEGDVLVAKTKGNKETFKYIVWYLTTTYETSQLMGMDAVFVHEVDKYYITNQAYWVDTVTLQKIIHRALLLKPLLIGKPAPAIIVQDSLNRNVVLYDIKAPYMVLIFWDPDCGHCQKIIPKLKELYESKLKPRGIKVLAIDNAESAEKWKHFIKEHNLEWLNAHDEYHQYFFHDLYDVYSTPVIYLLDDKKTIQAKRIDVDQLEGFIEHLEKQKELEKKGNQ